MMSPDNTKEIKQISTHIIVYHAHCIDGAASAWTVAKAFNIEDNTAKVSYIPYEHFNKADSEQRIREALIENADLYFVDCCPEKIFLDELLSPNQNSLPRVKALHILDHHLTADDVLQSYLLEQHNTESPPLDVYIDPRQQSAAEMIWHHLIPSEPPPALIGLINQMDGSGKGLKTEDDFSAAAYIDSKKTTNAPNSFDTLRGLATLSFNEMAQRGKPITAEITQQIDCLIKNTFIIALQLLPDTPPVDVPLINGNIANYGRLVSQKLTEHGTQYNSGVAFVWYLQKNGSVSVSMRSNGTPDLAKVTEYLRKTTGATGGGHSDAAAIHFPSILEFIKHMPMKYPLYVSCAKLPLLKKK